MKPYRTYSMTPRLHISTSTPYERVLSVADVTEIISGANYIINTT